MRSPCESCTYPLGVRHRFRRHEADCCAHLRRHARLNYSSPHPSARRFRNDEGASVETRKSCACHVGVPGYISIIGGVRMLAAIGHALTMSFAMTWEILWALILGFGLSAIIQAVVSKEEMSRLLPDNSARTVAVACGLGAASSSCSYAAVALARSMFRKGANFTAAMAFQFASTNLVVELGILLALLMGWQFTLAEFTGGPLMIAIMVLLFKAFLTPRIVEAAGQQADKGIQGTHGRTCRYGHVYSRRNHLAKDVFGQRKDCDQPLLRHG